jgi:transcriptional regulator with XRE-family HTH domain
LRKLGLVTGMVVNKLMNNKNQAMGVKASSEGIKKIQQRMAELVRPDNKEKRGWTQSNLAERSGVDLSTVRRLLHGIPIRYDFLSWIAEAVGLNVEELIERPLPDLQESSLDWLVICEEMLDKQRDANELRRKATGLGAENHVYMPLDLVETKAKKQEQTPNNQDESGNKLKTEEVIYPHAQFLEDLLNWRRENKHIAIAGEAGAGKTTFLVTIAEKLKDSQYLPIFIGLADLQGRSLKTYINDVWLPHAMNEREANEEQKESLFQQFQTGKIWLLLDALDEMQAKSSAEALDRINREIKEVIGQSRVVMTCRLNVWDAYINRLPNFDTFKMGNLSFEQIDSFISQWFSFTESPENASILQAKLKEPNRDRIRDMVRHPLRLALLCQAFYRNPNTDLPEIKAGLYELFVRYFYEWKPNIVDVDLRTQDSLQEELHQALGKLAIKAIDSDAGFRLSRSFAVKEMGNSDLFNLACNVGWLSLIDRNDLDEEIYSFFHATFQEYFAALAIDDHSFLLNHVPNNPLEDGYRVFQSKWKEVFLLWLGRTEDGLLSEKQALMSDLIGFQDNCGGFYTDRAFLLVAEGTSAFDDFDEIYDIIQRVVKEAFDCFNQLDHEVYFGSISSNELEKILYKTEPCLTVEEIIDLRDNFIDEYKILYKHGNLSIVNDPVDDSWFDNLKKEDKERLINKEFWVVETIGNIYPQNTWVVQRLTALLGLKGYDPSFLKAYQKHCVGVPEAITALQEEILTWEKQLKICEEKLKNKTSLQKSKKTVDLERIIQIKHLLKDFEETLKVIDPLHQGNVEIFHIEIDSLVSELRKNIYEITETDRILDINFVDISITKEIMHNIIKSCFNHYYSSSKYYGHNTNNYLFGDRNSHIVSNNRKKINTVKVILKNHPNSDILLIDIINNREYGYVFAIEFINDLTNDINISLIEKTLIGVINDTSLESSIRVYTAIVLNEICPSHIKSLLLLCDFYNIDINYVSSAFKSLRETDFSRLNHEHKLLLEEKLLHGLNNEEVLDKYFDCKFVHFVPVSSTNIACILGKIFPLHPHSKKILFNKFNLERWYKGICNDLELIGVSKSEIFRKLLPFLDNVWTICDTHELNHQVSRQSILFTLENLALDKSELLPTFIREYLLSMGDDLYDDWALEHIREYLFNTTKYTNYVEFNKIWQSCCLELNYFPRKSPNISSLNAQLIDCQCIQKELTKYPEIRCLVVDIRQLEQESNPNVIAEEIAIKIFDSLGREIPAINRVSNLKRELLNLKRVLGFEKLAIALYGKSANEAIDQLCQSLTPSIQTRLFTGGQTTQELIAKINAWLSEM